MASPNTISVHQLSRLVGTGNCPVIIDVRTDEDFEDDPRLIPGARRKAFAAAPSWSSDFVGRAAVIVCQHGKKLSEGVAAWLRHSGVPAEVLEGGHAAWAGAGLPLVQTGRLPPRDAEGRTVWVTRSRPKIDRLACPWLIRRFVDPTAVFLYVAPAEVTAVAERFGATPFDVKDVFWAHRGDGCTFDTMLEEFGVATPPLLHVARIVRAADTDRLDLDPAAAGLFAISLGLSRNFDDDLEQLEAGMVVYDALYRWCRDATGETHSW